MRRAVVAGCLFFAVGCASNPQRPGRDVSYRRHPNLAAAQHHIQEAFDAISRGQQANEWDLNGHAKKAKELLDQANEEIKQAAEAANHK